MKTQLLIGIIIFASVAFAQQTYDPGDWTTYRDTRGARAIDFGPHEIYVATDGGIVSYNFTRREWYDPIAVGYGISEAVPIENPIILLLDGQTGYVWVATRDQVLQFDTGMERWQIKEKNLWPVSDRVVNIGVLDQFIYLETIPEATYTSLFAAGPIPDDHWKNYVTLYKGNRGFGGFNLAMGNAPDSVRWRGLRTKVVIPDADLYGTLGRPPAGFPPLLPPQGWTWLPNGTLLDNSLRENPITDWAIDPWGYFWSTHWGVGIVTADLRTTRAKIFNQGPAGNDVRAILLTKDNVWIGGNNPGDRMGVSKVSRDMREWQAFDHRSDSRIQSLNVQDFADHQGTIWMATDEGLLSFNVEKNQWDRYSVHDGMQSDHLLSLAVYKNELWIGGVDGLSVMNLLDNKIVRVPNDDLNMTEITDIVFDEDTVYVGTDGGLFRGSAITQEITFADLDRGLLNNLTREISIAGDLVWVATAAGILRYDTKSGETKTWASVDWMKGAKLSCVCASEKFVWVGTEGRGFYRHNVKTGEWVEYNTKDGLADNRVLKIVRDRDDILIGTRNGLTRFYWNAPDRNK